MADPDEVMARIRSKEQAKVRRSGTISTTNWRFNKSWRQGHTTRFGRWAGQKLGETKQGDS